MPLLPSLFCPYHCQQMSGTCAPKQEQSPFHRPLHIDSDWGTNSASVAKLACGRSRIKVRSNTDQRKCQFIRKKLVKRLSGSFSLNQTSHRTSYRAEPPPFFTLACEAPHQAVSVQPVVIQVGWLFTNFWWAPVRRQVHKLHPEQYTPESTSQGGYSHRGYKVPAFAAQPMTMSINNLKEHSSAEAHALKNSLGAIKKINSLSAIKKINYLGAIKKILWFL